MVAEADFHTIPDRVKRLADQGADHVLVKPAAEQELPDVILRMIDAIAG